MRNYCNLKLYSGGNSDSIIINCECLNVSVAESSKTSKPYLPYLPYYLPANNPPNSNRLYDHFKPQTLPLSQLPWSVSPALLRRARTSDGTLMPSQGNPTPLSWYFKHLPGFSIRPSPLNGVPSSLTVQVYFPSLVRRITKSVTLVPTLIIQLYLT